MVRQSSNMMLEELLGGNLHLWMDLLMLSGKVRKPLPIHLLNPLENPI